MKTILSLFAGIGGFDLGFQRAGFSTIAVAEIEKFPCKVLAARFPEAVNLGDVTKIDGRQFAGKVDVVTFGSPCQDLSVAGKRAGLAGERSGLFHEAIRIISECMPKFAVWENVPGALSSNSGRDFGAVLDALGKCGAVDLAWRVLDARYFGVAQRRRRVFLVADFRGHRAGQILFERTGGAGDFAPRGEARERLAPSLAARTRGGGGLGTDAECDGALIPEVAWCLQERDAKGADSDTKPGHLIPVVAHSLRADGFNASEDGTGRGTPLVPVEISGDLFTCADCNHHWAATEWPNKCPNCDGPSYENVMIRPSVLSPIGNKESDDLLANTIGTTAFNAPQDPVVTGNVTGSVDTFSQSQAVAVSMRGRDGGGTAELTEGAHPALRASQGGGDKPHVLTGMRVRRLTPRECERLQGFPDDWTNIPGAADGPRYKALGNAVCVNVAEWIARRISPLV